MTKISSSPILILVLLLSTTITLFISNRNTNIIFVQAQNVDDGPVIYNHSGVACPGGSGASVYLSGNMVKSFDNKSRIIFPFPIRDCNIFILGAEAGTIEFHGEISNSNLTIKKFACMGAYHSSCILFRGKLQNVGLLSVTNVIRHVNLAYANKGNLNRHSLYLIHHLNHVNQVSAYVVESCEQTINIQFPSVAVEMDVYLGSLLVSLVRFSDQVTGLPGVVAEDLVSEMEFSNLKLSFQTNSAIQGVQLWALHFFGLIFGFRSLVFQRCQVKLLLVPGTASPGTALVQGPLSLRFFVKNRNGGITTVGHILVNRTNIEFSGTSGWTGSANKNLPGCEVLLFTLQTTASSITGASLTISNIGAIRILDTNFTIPRIFCSKGGVFIAAYTHAGISPVAYYGIINGFEISSLFMNISSQESRQVSNTLPFSLRAGGAGKGAIIHVFNTGPIFGTFCFSIRMTPLIKISNCTITLLKAKASDLLVTMLYNPALLKMEAGDDECPIDVGIEGIKLTEAQLLLSASGGVDWSGIRISDCVIESLWFEDIDVTSDSLDHFGTLAIFLSNGTVNDVSNVSISNCRVEARGSVILSRMISFYTSIILLERSVNENGDTISRFSKVREVSIDRCQVSIAPNYLAPSLANSQVAWSLFPILFLARVSAPDDTYGGFTDIGNITISNCVSSLFTARGENLGAVLFLGSALGAGLSSLVIDRSEIVVGSSFYTKSFQVHAAFVPEIISAGAFKNISVTRSEVEYGVAHLDSGVPDTVATATARVSVLCVDQVSEKLFVTLSTLTISASSAREVPKETKKFAAAVVLANLSDAGGYENVETTIDSCSLAQDLRYAWTDSLSYSSDGTTLMSLCRPTTCSFYFALAGEQGGTVVIRRSSIREPTKWRQSENLGRLSNASVIAGFADGVGGSTMEFTLDTMKEMQSGKLIAFIPGENKNLEKFAQDVDPFILICPDNINKTVLDDFNNTFWKYWDFESPDGDGTLIRRSCPPRTSTPSLLPPTPTRTEPQQKQEEDATKTLTVAQEEEKVLSQSFISQTQSSSSVVEEEEEQTESPSRISLPAGRGSSNTASLEEDTNSNTFTAIQTPSPSLFTRSESLSYYLDESASPSLSVLSRTSSASSSEELPLPDKLFTETEAIKTTESIMLLASALSAAPGGFVMTKKLLGVTSFAACPRAANGAPYREFIEPLGFDSNPLFLEISSSSSSSNSGEDNSNNNNNGGGNQYNAGDDVFESHRGSLVGNLILVVAISLLVYFVAFGVAFLVTRRDENNNKNNEKNNSDEKSKKKKEEEEEKKRKQKQQQQQQRLTEAEEGDEGDDQELLQDQKHEEKEDKHKQLKLNFQEQILKWRLPGRLFTILFLAGVATSQSLGTLPSVRSSIPAVDVILVTLTSSSLVLVPLIWFVQVGTNFKKNETLLDLVVVASKKKKNNNTNSEGIQDRILVTNSNNSNNKKKKKKTNQKKKEEEEEKKASSYLFDAWSIWIESDYVKSHGSLIENVAHPRFVSFDFAVAVTVGLAAGSGSLCETTTCCTTSIVFSLIASFLHFVVLLLARPLVYLCRFDVAISLVGSALLLTQTILVFVAMTQSKEEGDKQQVQQQTAGDGEAGSSGSGTSGLMKAIEAIAYSGIAVAVLDILISLSQAVAEFFQKTKEKQRNQVSNRYFDEKKEKENKKKGKKNSNNNNNNSQQEGEDESTFRSSSSRSSSPTASLQSLLASKKQRSSSSQQEQQSQQQQQSQQNTRKDPSPRVIVTNRRIPIKKKKPQQEEQQQQQKSSSSSSSLLQIPLLSSQNEEGEEMITIPNFHSPREQQEKEVKEETKRGNLPSQQEEGEEEEYNRDDDNDEEELDEGEPIDIENFALNIEDDDNDKGENEGEEEEDEDDDDDDDDDNVTLDEGEEYSQEELRALLQIGGDASGK